jgi:CRP/FNR family transcriptional regulator, transcriptional activator FtrB
LSAALEQACEAETIPFLAGTRASTRQNLLRGTVVHSVAAGTILFEQGEPPHFQHVLLSGSILPFGRSTAHREILIESVMAPNLVVPAAVVTASPYLMQSRVPEASRLLLIHADAFRAAMASDPALAQAVIGSLAGQFRRMVRQIKSLKLRPALQRVGCYILALAKRQGTPHRVILPYSKNLIASELGITRESFSRALAVLQDTSIRVEGEMIYIRDPVRLAADAMPDPLIDDTDEQGT